VRVRVLVRVAAKVTEQVGMAVAVDVEVDVEADVEASMCSLLVSVRWGGGGRSVIMGKWAVGVVESRNNNE